MQTIPDSMDLILPFGEALRGLLEQPFISSADLKHVLRSRGVFLGKNEKQDSIPVLTCCLLAPNEFDSLRECQAIKEDNPKAMTRTIAWSSSKNLLDAIPQNFDLSTLVEEYSNYKIIGTPAFAPVNKDLNHIACEFEIERLDLSKNWTNVKSNFKDSVSLEKIAEGSELKLTMIHTAEETKGLNRRAIQTLENHFKQAGDIKPESKIETILFGSFDNEKRIAFFRNLTDKNPGPCFKFVKVTDFGLCPERGVELPNELKWMEDTVTDFKVRGDALQKTFFIRGKDFHKYILFHSIEAKFDFEFGGTSGICSIAFEFPSFALKRETTSELEVNVASLVLSQVSREHNKTVVKAELLRRMNDIKLAQFELLRERPRNAQSDAASNARSSSLQTAFAWDPA